VPILKVVSSVLSISLLALLFGCSPQGADSSPAGVTSGIGGRVRGGQQPVSGATIQLYTVGATADGSASTPLLTQTVKTDASGSFSITGLYSNCAGATQVYLTATGGNPGGSTPNPNLLLMSALGPCSALTSGTFLTIDELTTVAAVAALAPYTTSPTAIGSGTSDAAALASAFTLASELVSPGSGNAPGQGVPAASAVPVATINTLGDIMASCVNSTGGTAGDGSACGTLFSLATPSGGTAPSDTFTAMLNVNNNPTANATAIYNLASPTGPFQPTLASAPLSLLVRLLTRTFYVFPEADGSVTPLYALVNGAQKTIDMTMYELVDTTFSGDLVAACQRGVRVRVILDQNDEKSSNTAAYNQLNAQTNCSAAWANPAFQVTHEKSFIVDGKQVAILTLNLTSRYYGATYNATRDFGLIENDPSDIAAIQATFNTDYGSTTDYSYQPAAGDDLIWSPTTAQPDLLAIINNATSTLLVENEEMSAASIVTALENACKRGVAVHIAMTTSSSYAANFSALEAAGCGVHVYANNTSTLYIHAKAMLADYGTSAVTAYVGSINFSNASMTENRELGLYVSDPGIQQTLYTTISSDYAGAPAY
jgi:HKD family nuclease